MKPEEKAREKIDRQLEAAGWIIQDLKEINLGAGLGIAVREFPLKTGDADYLLFVDRKAAGVVEAKKVGVTLSGVAEQTSKYQAGVPDKLPHVDEPLPFAYETTGVETFFRDSRDPDTRSRRLFAFHTPKELQDLLKDDTTLRARLRQLPPLVTDPLRDCQIEAITNLERSFANNHPRSLIQMATGSGKTFTAVSFMYRLVKFAGAKRILFLVDRNNLGRQTFKEFQQFSTPDDGRKFTELYNVQHLTSNTFDPVSRVCISTIQRVYSMLKGEKLDTELEEHSQFDTHGADAPPVTVSYSHDIPIGTFDFIVTDECHRSIYSTWRQVLEYFDSFLIGLTATPSKQTLGFFNNNLVMEYPHERAVADGVNVGYDVYRIKTRITEGGSKVEAGDYVDKRDKMTRELRWEQLDEDLDYESNQLDRDVVAIDQIRTVIRTFRDKLFTDIFPGRTEVPKTLVFAKDDSHAEDIVHIVREEFGKGNDFCKKVTYRTTGEKTEDLIASFRNSYNPRIAVSVDMIATGTDIKPLECLLFMRDVKSRSYFEQMKGRGTRVIDSTSLQSVTPDAVHKTHFVLVDAVGVCETDKTDTKPLERKKSIPFDKLLIQVAQGIRDDDTLSTLAGRLARLDREIDDDDRHEIKKVSGCTMSTLINGLLDSIDPDQQLEQAREQFDTDEPTEEELVEAKKTLVDKACRPFDDPRFRSLLCDIKKRSEQVIDKVSTDEVIYAGGDEAAKEKARADIQSFKKFIDDNRDELTALQIFYNQPYGKRHLTYEAIKELANAIKKPPYHLEQTRLWSAYKLLESSRVRGAGTDKLLANLVSLVRFAIGEAEVLEPFSATVEQRFGDWIDGQKASGAGFTDEQLRWLEMIRDHIATNVNIVPEDFDLAPFYDKGGLIKAHNLFGDSLNKLIEELNEALAA